MKTFHLNETWANLSPGDLLYQKKKQNTKEVSSGSGEKVCGKSGAGTSTEDDVSVQYLFTKSKFWEVQAKLGLDPPSVRKWVWLSGRAGSSKVLFMIHVRETRVTQVLLFPARIREERSDCLSVSWHLIPRKWTKYIQLLVLFSWRDWIVAYLIYKIFKGKKGHIHRSYKTSF